MIKRIFKSEVPPSKLRLHSSEKTSPWNIIFPKFKEAIKDEDIRYYPNIKTSKAYSLLQDFYSSDNLCSRNSKILVLYLIINFRVCSFVSLS